ncbi:branched-chain amino acid aminotransferase [Trichoderma cornu-damae]|uniref:Branched-chain amino acid aminotransferase n=1 Tax=Trichoderma cornu-damae TaxID=654480 RepID=A0A9P8QM20_9HYPO|nr:branched-chain amino acid aminotransferase [Trichoderma cornu-damae]
MAPPGDSFRDIKMTVVPPTDHDGSRGRTRDRNIPNSKSLRPDESSTLRGRSRRRSVSPFNLTSRTSSPSVKSSANRLMLHNRLREKRREHCPSRMASPASQEVFQQQQQQQQQKQQRMRSRSRGPRMEKDLHRPVDLLSSLRNEVFLSDEETSHDKTC